MSKQPGGSEREGLLQDEDEEKEENGSTIDRRQSTMVTLKNEIWDILWSIQALSLSILTVQQTVMPLVVRYAKKREMSEQFIATTTVFIMEIMRTCICSTILIYTYGSFTTFVKKFKQTVFGNPMETFKVCVPAIIYAIQNNLYYVALENIDATAYSITYQLRILTTAILSIVMLNKAISLAQWGALMMSVCGVVIVQLDQSDHRRLLAAQKGNAVIGIAATIGMCWTSAFAGVYFEKVLKKSPVDLWMQNIRLSLMGMPFSAITMLVSDYDKIKESRFFDLPVELFDLDGLFYGWDWLIWLITILSALGGLVVSAVVKYADNVKKTYCQSVAIAGTAMISYMMKDINLSLLSLLGIGLVISSLFVYAFNPPAPANTKTSMSSGS